MLDVNHDNERSGPLINSQNEPVPINSQSDTLADSEANNAHSEPTRGRQMSFSRPRLHTDPVTRTEMETALKTDPIKQFCKAPLTTSAYASAWGAMSLGTAINDMLGISRLAKTKRWRERQQEVLWIPSLEHVAEDPRPPFATVSGAILPPSPPASPPSPVLLAPNSCRERVASGFVNIIAGLVILAVVARFGAAPRSEVSEATRGNRVLQDIPTPEEAIDNWYTDRRNDWNTLRMCALTQQQKATPWASFAGDNFVTLAVKGVVIGDVWSELVGSFRSNRNLEGWRFAFSLALMIVGLLGDVTNTILLLIVTFNLVFSGSGKDLSIFEWSGYLGCVGATQSFVIPSFLCAVLFPFICLAVLAAGLVTMKDDGGDEESKRSKGFVGLLMIGVAAGMFNASVGFIIFIFGGIPSVFPMVGMVICALTVTCVITLVLMIPDMMLSRLKGDESIDAQLGSKMGINAVMTVIMCVPRSAMVWGIGVGKGYSFAFTTIGSMPIREENDREGINLIFGGQDSTIYETSIQIAAWVTLVKIAVQCFILLCKYFNAICSCCCCASDEY